jgi:hypothetical protein
MSKSSIFEEFIKNKEAIEKIESKNEDTIVEEKVEEKLVEEPKIISIIDEVDLYKSPEFIAFKEKFLQEENVDILMEMFNQNRKNGAEIFDNDFYIYQKMLDKKIRLLIIEPSNDDVILNKKGQFFLVKPIYSKEYKSFVKEHGSRLTSPEEYEKFAVIHGTLFPKITEQTFETITAGVVNSLFETIDNLSDFQKTYRVMEI